MKNLLGLIFIISLASSVILLFVCVCNYLIAYVTTGDGLIHAISNNVYVHYWVALLSFFIGTLVLSFIGFLIVKPGPIEDEGFQVYENQSRVFYGQGTVDEYVTVRIKKDDLSKLQG